eukprot:6213286-Pleurochrysis_carterae.AAC.1
MVSSLKLLLTALLVISNVPTGVLMAPKGMTSCAARAGAASSRPSLASGENGCNSCRSHSSTRTSSAAYTACSMATTATAAAAAACAAAVAARAAQTRNPLRSRTEQHAMPNRSGGQTSPCAGTAGHAPSAAGGEPAVDDDNESKCAVCDDDDAEHAVLKQQKNDETPPRVKISTRNYGSMTSFHAARTEPITMRWKTCYFVIGPRNDCCVAAACLTSGLSFQIFAANCEDCTRNRPYHSGRMQTHDRLDSIERASIEGYILELRDTMEGDEGALARGVQKWHTGKLPSRIRFEDYKTSQIQSRLPVYGSHSLFKKI